jgi:hypothetical protein
VRVAQAGREQRLHDRRGLRRVQVAGDDARALCRAELPGEQARLVEAVLIVASPFVGAVESLAPRGVQAATG